MKLAIVMLFSLAVLASCDTYENYQTDYRQGPPAQSHHFNRRQSRGKGGLAGLVKRFFGFGGNRRQFQFTGTGTGTGTGTAGGFTTGGGVGTAPLIAGPAAGTTGGFGFGSLAPLLLVGLLFGLAAAGIIAALAAINLNNSGRGLDTDEWEVDHSVWMDQLQKDFEDSWSTE